MSSSQLMIIPPEVQRALKVFKIFAFFYQSVLVLRVLFSDLFDFDKKEGKTFFVLPVQTKKGNRREEGSPTYAHVFIRVTDVHTHYRKVYTIFRLKCVGQEVPS